MACFSIRAFTVDGRTLRKHYGASHDMRVSTSYNSISIRYLFLACFDSHWIFKEIDNKTTEGLPMDFPRPG